MRICVVTLDFAPFRSSGLSIYTEILVNGLARRGHRVTVIAASRPISKRVEDLVVPRSVEVRRVTVGPFDWLGLGWQAARYLSFCHDTFDIIHFADIHFAYACFRPFIASAFQSFRQRLTSYKGQPYHTSCPDHIFRLIYYNLAKQLMEKPSIKRAAHIVMSSVATWQEFVEKYHVNPARATLIYPGINLSRFEKLPEKTAARRYLALPIDRPILLYVGFSTPRKGVEYLAYALKHMKTPAFLVMVGKWEPTYQKRFLKSLGGAASRVHLAGYVPDAELPAYFSAADVFVLPTLLEGFGITLVEAMAAGLPVVTTQAGAAKEVVGEGGLAVQTGNGKALAEAIDQILSDPNLAKQLGETGRHRAYTLFNEHRFIVEIESLYQRFLTRNDPAYSICNYLKLESKR